jgi:hypothetical protein
MGIWIELGVFLLVFVFAAWQFHDLRQARAAREARERAIADPEMAPPAERHDSKP